MNVVKSFKKKRELRRINSKIEKQIECEKETKAREYKVLLLGTSEAGKSTLVKQLKLLHGVSFTRREQEDAKEVILSNLVVSVYCILCQPSNKSSRLLEYTKYLYTTLTDSERKEITTFTSSLVKPESFEETAELVKRSEEDYFVRYPGWQNSRTSILRKIWNDQAFTEIILSLAPMNLPDSALYFLTNFERITDGDFMPTSKDMIRMRKSTTGVTEALIPVGDRTLRLVDVGGQRSERKKWLHCFDDVTAVIFVASLSEYNLELTEDRSQNRLQESIALFKTLVESKIFVNQKVILFLNKKDIFEMKIMLHDLKESFKDFHGNSKDKDEAKDFILNKFLEKRKKIIYSHQTTAVDPFNVQQVFSAVKQTIFNSCIDAIWKQGLF